MIIFDAFSGIWGFSLALQQVIWKENVTFWFSENDKFAKQIYLENFPNAKDLGELNYVDLSSLPDFDLLTGWFPCQPFSNAGKWLWKNDKRWKYIYKLLEILYKKQPKYFVFENVKWFLNEKHKDIRNETFNKINNLWYNFNYKILNTKDYWLPQTK